MAHAQLAQAGIASAEAEAEWLLCESLGMSRMALYLAEGAIAHEQLRQIEDRLRRRIRGEPLQYILGTTEFYGGTLRVSPAVFIPRPETECLIERAHTHLRAISERRPGPVRVLDVGTGSGNIAIALARGLATCFVVGIELSWKALEMARANAAAHGVASKIRLIQADWTTALRVPSHVSGARFDLLISNPPYVRADEMARLPPEGHHEPRMSLEGGEDGMAFYASLLVAAPRLLAAGGALGMECAPDQADPLADTLRASAWAGQVEVYRDLAGRRRGVWVTRRIPRARVNGTDSD